MSYLGGTSARVAVAGVANGLWSVETIARVHLERIAEVEPSLGAWQYVDPNAVIEAAKALDRSTSAGLMRGALLGVKDLICTADMPTTFGSAAYDGHRPAYDAACVALARQAGALVVGKTVTTEFAYGTPGKTRNPHNPAHTPGGSSSGSAAAVAAGMVPIAIGTQTGGSIIRPAAYCGVVGYKPTYDLIDKTGVKPLAVSFDTVGVIACDVRDAAFYTAHVTLRPDLEPGDAPAMSRIGFYRSEAWPNALPEAQIALDHAVEALGGSVAEVRHARGFDGLLDLYKRMKEWEMTTTLAYERVTIPDRISPRSRADFEAIAARASAAIFDAAEAEALKIRARIDDLFGEYHLLLTPPATGEAPEGLDATGNASFNQIWSFLHLPCVTIPAGVGPRGLPVGVQLIARKKDDARLLAAAAWLEASLARKR
ncbi:amidase [Bradyrhizobium elkanii]|uniref:Amidase n=1 Tax=Bradyrhizobium elkanii TaxID=29448 RepID=A0A8I1YKN9_BRAEL|nr:amidase [Bradyrhizobium elkanii]MBP1299816.1 amidase [Bradyrhizobium elkanii]